MRRTLQRYKKGEIDIDEAESILTSSTLHIPNIARFDIFREQRSGIPEVILADGKTPSEVASIAKAAIEHSERVLVSRVEPDHLRALRGLKTKMHFNSRARACVIGNRMKNHKGLVGILAAGTSDINVAEEARFFAEEMGAKVETAYDVGVAGVHRLAPELERMLKEKADILIVVAGREGALPTLVAGISGLPVIGVPVSTGYGLGGKGISALNAMLQSCSPLVVVNIDGGFVAGSFAAQIIKRRGR